MLGLLSALSKMLSNRALQPASTSLHAGTSLIDLLKDNLSLPAGMAGAICCMPQSM